MPKVKCPNCCQCFHETTEKFDPNKAPDGSMLRLLEPWRSWGWSPFGDDDGRDIETAETAVTVCADLCCPECLSQLAPSGRLLIVEKKEAADKGIDQETIEHVKTMLQKNTPWKEMLKESKLSVVDLSKLVKEIKGTINVNASPNQPFEAQTGDISGMPGK